MNKKIKHEDQYCPSYDFALGFSETKVEPHDWQVVYITDTKEIAKVCTRCAATAVLTVRANVGREWILIT